MKASLQRILFTSLVLALTSTGFITLQSVKATKSIDLGDIMDQMSRAKLQKLLGDESKLIDSLPTTDAKHRSADVYVYAPVNILGFPSIAHAEFYHDKLSKVTFYLPYHARMNVKPAQPYEQGHFVGGSMIDFDSVTKRLSRRFGNQSISSETFLVFVSDTNRPYIAASFKDHTIEISVTPNHETP